MMIQDTTRDLNQPKTVKVTLPARIHIQLHRLKILGGQTISDTIQEALESYFEQIRQTQVGEDVDVGPDPERP